MFCSSRKEVEESGQKKLHSSLEKYKSERLESGVLTLLMTASAPFLGSVHSERPEQDCLRFLEEEEEECFPSPANDGKIIA